MCTCLAMCFQDFYFGRNMDIDYSFNEKIVITPRNFPFNFSNNKKLNHHLAFIGCATIIDNYPLYAEACNEKGLCICGLNFTNNAIFNKDLLDNKDNIAVFELIPWILSQCETVEQAKYLIRQINIIDKKFNDKVPNASLHWQISDKDSSIVLECTDQGVQIYNNQLGVLTNNPPFPFQLFNLSNYLNLTVFQPRNCFSDLNIKYSNGLGCYGLPGDFSSISRFVKLSFLKLNTINKTTENECISQFFHLLDSVLVINGSIKDKQSEYYTTYSCCINASKKTYYYKTYNSFQIKAIKLFNEDLNGKELIIFSFDNDENIAYMN